MNKSPGKLRGFSTSDEQPYEPPHRKLSREAAEEGIVLLENRDGLLPLEEGSSVALYGRGGSKTVKGGTGSGDVNEREDVSILEGLRNAGIRVVNEKWISDFDREYEEKRKEWRDWLLSASLEAEANEEGNFFDMYAANPYEAPLGNPPEKEDCDTAIFVISRVAGEAADRRNKPGDYYLSGDEERFLDELCRLYDRVIVVLNTGGVLDLSFMDSHKNIGALIFMCQAGMEGGNALADILCGKVSPSGHLTDTWCYDYEDYPGASDFSFINEDLTTEKYEEGLYVGYRYFDSLGIPVRYGFGYGLTYGEFLTEMDGIQYDEDKSSFSVSVNVTNIGDAPAKEVVQIYVSCPQEGLEKEFRRLAGFKKTALIPADGREKVTVEIPLDLLTSYDGEVPGCVLEKGTYGVWVGSSLDRSVLSAALELNETKVLYKTLNFCLPENDLREFSIPLEERMDISDRWHSRLREEDLPIINIDAGSLKTEAAEYGKDEDIDAGIKEKVDSLSEEKLISLVVGAITDGGNAATVGASGFKVPGGAGDTSYLAQEDGIPSIATADGPAGVRIQEKYRISDGRVRALPFIKTVEHGFFDTDSYDETDEVYYQYCTAFPVGTLLASSWNPDLIEEVGKAVAEEMEVFGVSLWLAPGLNIHRNPLCGRNFEYFSEDPFVSGKTALAMTKGVQSVQGCGVTIKHFACNNCEDNRYFSNSVLSERTLREIYLKGFEIAVREGDPASLMTSYNKVNGIHSANHKDLISRILRDEWGFKGMVMTDWTTTWHGDNCSAAGCVLAGNDLTMPGHPDDLWNIKEALKQGTLTLEDIRKCAYRVVRTVYRMTQKERD